MRAWTAAAHRGELELVVMTAARWRQHVPDLPLSEGTQLLGFVIPDDRESFSLCFDSSIDVAGFIRELQPRAWGLAVAEGEDWQALYDALREMSAAENLVMQ